MDPDKLIEGKPYITVQDVNVCNYSDGVCSLQNKIKLEEKTKLIYRGHNEHEAGFIFEAENGNQYCLHQDDLLYINFAE